jgi:hypothetical protein
MQINEHDTQLSIAYAIFISSFFFSLSNVQNNNYGSVANNWKEEKGK